MKFKKLKLLFLCVMGTGFLGLSTLASGADDLIISNGSKNDLSFKIQTNHYVCSEEFGVVNGHSIKVISEANFKKACAHNPSQCVVEVYDTASCTGTQIANLTFNIKYGVIFAVSTGQFSMGLNQRLLFFF